MKNMTQIVRIYYLKYSMWNTIRTNGSVLIEVGLTATKMEPKGRDRQKSGGRLALKVRLDPLDVWNATAAAIGFKVGTHFRNTKRRGFHYTAPPQELFKNTKDLYHLEE